MNGRVRPAPNDLPGELATLIQAADCDCDVGPAWSAFLACHCTLLLSAVQVRTDDHDLAMDRYAFLVEHLQAENFRRLRAYRPDGRTKFTTWLVVVAKRLVVDHHRQRYGRPQGPDTEQGRADGRARRQLVDLVSADVDLTTLADPTAPDPDTCLARLECRSVLQSVIGALDPADRLLLTLRFVDEATAWDIANVMGFPSQFHVYRALRRVTRSLKRALQDRGIRSSDDL